MILNSWYAVLDSRKIKKGKVLGVKSSQKILCFSGTVRERQFVWRMYARTEARRFPEGVLRMEIYSALFMVSNMLRTEAVCSFRRTEEIPGRITAASI